MEPYGLDKGDFDKAARLISNCRKDGNLPLHFTTDDTESKWAFDNVQQTSSDTPEEAAAEVMDYVEEAEFSYHPVSFWDYQNHYVEMLVEKSSLKGLFNPVCAEFYLPIGIAGGSWSINMRADLLLRLARWQAKGNDCVLLNCFDHDVHGKRISRTLRQNLQDVVPAFKAEYPRHKGFDLDDVEIVRFGLNAEFIDANGFTWIDGLETANGKNLADPTHPKHSDYDVQEYLAEHGPRKVEGEALLRKPEVGRDLCRQAILQYVDDDGVERFKQERDEKREEMRDHLSTLFTRS